MISATRAIILVAIGLLFHAQSIPAATLPSGFAETQYGADVGSGPTAMDFSPDGRLFVCLQGGDVRVISSSGVLLANAFVHVPTIPSGERGLLGVAFDPAFASNQFVYFYYTFDEPAFHNRIVRYTANGNVAMAGSEVVILELDNLSGATNHNGGSIHFGSDGKLYVAVGENANASNSQTLSNRLGKILRINSDGAIPSDNPTTFPGIAGSPSGDNRAIWAVGFRNPFTFGIQPGTGRIFINDVGEVTWEEINDGIAGSNYGWNICEGFCSPTNPTYRDPLFEYAHGGTPTTGCAIVGGAFYNPAINQFPASYTGKYFFGDLCGGWIRLFDPSNNTASDFALGVSTPVDLKVGPDGSLYYLAQGNGGEVWKVRSTLPTPTPGAVTISGTVSYCSNPAPGPVPNVTLSLTGSATSSTLSNASGNYQFSSLGPGSYIVTPSKPDRVPGSIGVSTADVLAVQRHFLNVTPIPAGCRLMAADVNGDASVTTADVLAIQRFFLGLTTGTANTGKYQFTPASRTFSGINTSQTGQNFDTLVFGDVSAPFAERPAGVSPDSSVVGIRNP